MLRLRSASAQADDEATPHVHGLGILESAPRAVAWSQAHERAFTPHTTQHTHVVDSMTTGQEHCACMCDCSLGAREGRQENARAKPLPWGRTLRQRRRGQVDSHFISVLQLEPVHHLCVRQPITLRVSAHSPSNTWRGVRRARSVTQRGRTTTELWGAVKSATPAKAVSSARSRAARHHARAGKQRCSIDDGGGA
jgi:hypothetical protein